MSDDNVVDIRRYFITKKNFAREVRKAISDVRRWLNEGVRIVITPGEAKRADVQNRLAQVWKGQVARAMPELPEYTWGRWKLDYLLPLKLADDRQHERAVIEEAMVYGAAEGLVKLPLFSGVGMREPLVYAAFNTIRSKDIGTRLFAQWMTTLQDVEAEEGRILLARDAEEVWALFQSSSRHAA